MPHFLPNPSPRGVTSKLDQSGERGWSTAALLGLWHLASLDAPTVAAVWSCGFAWAVHVRLPAWAPIDLALMAWVIYVGDRLLDAHAGLRTPPKHFLRDRHYFHWRHRLVLASLASVAALASAWMVVAKLPPGARVPDSAIAAATLAYFSGVHSRAKLPAFAEQALSPILSKGSLIGVLFTAGCLLPIWSQGGARSQPISEHQLLPVMAVYFMGLAWLNCYAIGKWETGQSTSGPRRVRQIGILLGAVGALLAGALVATESRCAAILAAGALAALLLALLDVFPSRMSALTLRAAADLVLLTPALLIPVGFLCK